MFNFFGEILQRSFNKMLNQFKKINKYNFLQAVCCKLTHQCEVLKLWDGPMWPLEDAELPTKEWEECSEYVLEVVWNNTVLMNFCSANFFWT